MGAAASTARTFESLRSAVTTPIRLAALAVGVISFAMYALTTMPGVSFGDSAEAQAVPYLLGIAHPTGYPSYTLLQWLFDLLPIGSIAYRANLFSGLCASVGLAALTLTLGHLSVRPVLAATTALVVGATETLWRHATVADVHTLHLMFLALLLHRLVLWGEERRPRHLYLGALLLGLAFGNHMLTATVAPLFGLAALWIGRREIVGRPVLAVGALASLAAGLSVYAYLPLRGLQRPPFMYGDTTTWEGFWAIVSGSQFGAGGQLLSPAGPGRSLATLPAAVGLAIAQATPVFVAVGLAGLVVLLVRRPAFGTFVVALAASNVYVYANYFGGTLHEYLFATWLVLAIGFGVALEALVRRMPAASRPFAAASPALLAAWVTLATLPVADRSQDRAGDAFLAELYAHLPAGAALITYWDAATPIKYSQLVDGARPDVAVLTSVDDVPALARERPVYVLQVFDAPLGAGGGRYGTREVTTIRVPYGGLTRDFVRPLLKVEPRDPEGRRTESVGSVMTSERGDR